MLLCPELQQYELLTSPCDYIVENNISTSSELYQKLPKIMQWITYFVVNEYLSISDSSITTKDHGLLKDIYKYDSETGIYSCSDQSAWKDFIDIMNNPFIHLRDRYVRNYIPRLTTVYYKDFANITEQLKLLDTSIKYMDGGSYGNMSNFIENKFGYTSDYSSNFCSIQYGLAPILSDTKNLRIASDILNGKNCTEEDTELMENLLNLMDKSTIH